MKKIDKNKRKKKFKNTKLIQMSQEGIKLKKQLIESVDNSKFEY